MHKNSLSSKSNLIQTTSCLTHSFMYSFNQYLSSSCFVSDITLEMRDSRVRKRETKKQVNKTQSGFFFNGAV